MLAALGRKEKMMQMSFICLAQTVTYTVLQQAGRRLNIVQSLYLEAFSRVEQTWQQLLPDVNLMTNMQNSVKTGSNNSRGQDQYKSLKLPPHLVTVKSIGQM